MPTLTTRKERHRKRAAANHRPIEATDINCNAPRSERTSGNLNGPHEDVRQSEAPIR